MPNERRTGNLIAFEGIDVAGKNTQFRRLAARLNRTDEAVGFSFPDYQTPSGQAIHSFLREEWRCTTDDQSIQVRDNIYEQSPLVLQSLFLFNRAEKADEMQRLLDRGVTVLCDRYWVSGLAYGVADGLPYNTLVNVHKVLPRADLMILIDIPVEESVRRRPERADFYEKNLLKLSTIRNLYREFFSKNHQDPYTRWASVDGMGTVEEVEERIWSLVSLLFEDRDRS